MLNHNNKHRGSIKDRFYWYKNNNCHSAMLIREKLGRDLTQNEMVHLALLFKSVSGINPSRDEKRSKTMLLKMFENRLEQFSAFLDRIAFQDNEGNIGGPMKNHFTDRKSVV